MYLNTTVSEWYFYETYHNYVFLFKTENKILVVLSTEVVIITYNTFNDSETLANPYGYYF